MKKYPSLNTMASRLRATSNFSILFCFRLCPLSVRQDSVALSTWRVRARSCIQRQHGLSAVV